MSTATLPISPSTATTPVEGAMLFYDGTCGFCSATVQFVIRHEGSQRSLRFAALQGVAGEALRKAHPELGMDSMVWYEPPRGERRERLLQRSSAAIALGRYLGGVWRVLAVVSWWVPRPLRDAAYNLVARNRYRIADKTECTLPAPEQRSRFVD